MLNFLTQHNLKATNSEKVKFFFEYCNVCRSSIYVNILKNKLNYQINNFEEVIDYYFFDKKYRRLIFQYISHIEVFFRNTICRISNKIMSDKKWYKDNAYFNNVDYHSDFLKILLQSTNIKHLSDFNIIIEELSIGTISKFYKNLSVKPNNLGYELKSTIAVSLNNITIKILISFLQEITNARNICAHHSSLYDQHFSYVLKKLPNNKTNLNLIAAIYILLGNIKFDDYQDTFKNDLIALFSEFNNVKYLFYLDFKTIDDFYIIFSKFN